MVRNARKPFCAAQSFKETQFASAATDGTSAGTAFGAAGGGAVGLGDCEGKVRLIATSGSCAGPRSASQFVGSA